MTSEHLDNHRRSAETAAPPNETVASLAVEINGQPLLLCPERAIFDPNTRSLFVADIHFGKAATFRAHGIPVPSGTTRDNLKRLDAMIARHAPERVIFLGDLLHAKPAQAKSIVDALLEWRERHAGLALVLVKGNHDQHAGPPAAILGVAEVDEPWCIGAWTLCHHPQAVPGAYVLAGHLHPATILRTPREQLRLPCFAFNKEWGVLPAFGDFTGGYLVDSRDGQVFVVAGDRVAAINPPAGAHARSLD